MRNVTLAFIIDNVQFQPPIIKSALLTFIDSIKTDYLSIAASLDGAASAVFSSFTIDHYQTPTYQLNIQDFSNRRVISRTVNK